MNTTAKRRFLFNSRSATETDYFIGARRLWKDVRVYHSLFVLSKSQPRGEVGSGFSERSSGSRGVVVLEKMDFERATSISVLPSVFTSTSATDASATTTFPSDV